MIVNVRKADGSWCALKLLRGPKGDKGDTGEPGTSLVLLDAYDTLDALKSAHPTGNVGDAYAVGADVYLWSQTIGGWKLLGTLEGAPGKDGEDGTDGVGISSVEQTSASDEDGGANVVTITLTNGDKIDVTIRNGSKGEPGAPGAAPSSFPASGITGVLPAENGGTGYTNLADLAAALGVGGTAGIEVRTFDGNASKSSTTWREISLGYQPSFVLVWLVTRMPWYTYHDSNGVEIGHQYGGMAVAGHPCLLDGTENEVLKVTSGGFAVRNFVDEESGDHSYVAYLNLTGKTYAVFACK